MWFGITLKAKLFSDYPETLIVTYRNDTLNEELSKVAGIYVKSDAPFSRGRPLWISYDGFDKNVGASLFYFGNEKL